MQTYYWQILIDGKPYGMKIWNKSSAKVVYEKVKRDIENNIDYKGEKIELVKLDN